MTAAEFRKLFPALERLVWLDSPACPPGADPVVQAMRDALSAWSSGSFTWADWQESGQASRRLFAQFVGVPVDDVALVASTGEAAATVARGLPPGDIVVSEKEYRSSLFPFAAVADERHRVVEAKTSSAGVRAEDLIAAIGPQTSIVVVSDLLSQDGHRVDLRPVRAAADDVGAALFVDATQSMGVLRFDYKAIRPDYLAVHGYKWMLCPRGAAWLVVRDAASSGLAPLMPNVQTDAVGGYFGGRLQPWSTAARWDTSPAWLSWVGAEAALQLMAQLPQAAVEQHCLALADRFRDGARAAGARPLDDGSASHIVTVEVSDAEAVFAAMSRRNVRCIALGDRVRVGFHYFNNDSDADTALEALA
jgi:selenocysteine lyase/cysteine desulfurase